MLHESGWLWLSQNWAVFAATLPGWISLAWLLLRERPVIKLEIIGVDHRLPSEDATEAIFLQVEFRNVGNKPSTIRGATLRLQGPRGPIELQHERDWDRGILHGQIIGDSIYELVEPGAVVRKRLRFFAGSESFFPGRAKLFVSLVSGKSVKCVFQVPGPNDQTA